AYRAKTRIVREGRRCAQAFGEEPRVIEQHVEAAESAVKANGAQHDRLDARTEQLVEAVLLCADAVVIELPVIERRRLAKRRGDRGIDLAVRAARLRAGRNVVALVREPRCGE